MLFDGERSKTPKGPPFGQNGLSKNKPTPQQTPDSTAAMYTGLVMLLEMRRQLGLEAMLEYMDAYQDSITQSNPYFARMVQDVIHHTNVTKIYGDMCHGGDEFFGPFGQG